MSTLSSVFQPGTARPHLLRLPSAFRWLAASDLSFSVHQLLLPVWSTHVLDFRRVHPRTKFRMWVRSRRLCGAGAVILREVALPGYNRTYKSCPRTAPAPGLHAAPRSQDRGGRDGMVQASGYRERSPTTTGDGHGDLPSWVRGQVDTGQGEVQCGTNSRKPEHHSALTFLVICLKLG